MPKIKYKVRKEKRFKDYLDQPIDRKKAGLFLHLTFLPLMLVLIDQLTKWFVAHNMHKGEEIQVIPSLFNIQYVVNKGAALGIFHNKTVFLVIISSLMIAFIYYLAIYDLKLGHPITPELFIIGGAFGNLIDRVFLAGAVRDFLEVPFFAVMNFADWFVSVGIGLLVIKYLYYFSKEDSDGIH